MTISESADLWDQLRRKLRWQRQPIGASTARLEGAPGEVRNPRTPQTPPASSRTFQSKVTDMMAGARAELVSGKVNLLNLCEVRERLGDKWTRHEERIHLTITETLKRRLTDKDFFTRHEDDSYVIVFGELSKKEAEVKCALLGKEISRKLFGDDCGEDGLALGVQTMVGTVDGNAIARDVDIAGALSNALGDRGTVVPVPAETKPEATALEELDIQESLRLVERLLSEIEAKCQGSAVMQGNELLAQLRTLETFLASVQAASPRAETGDARSDATHVDWKGEWIVPPPPVRTLIEKIERLRSQEMAAEASSVPGNATDGKETEIDFSYLPAWNALKERIGVYFCEPIIRHHASEDINTALAWDGLDPMELDTLDRIVLRQASQDIEKAILNDRPCLVSVPVHFSTLNRATPAQQYFQLCHDLPKDLRKHMIWEILGAPAGAWWLQLPRIVAGLRRHGRTVFLRPDPKDVAFGRAVRDFGLLQQARIRSIGLDLVSFPETHGSRDQILWGFAESARRHGLNTYLRGVSSQEMADASVNMGFEFLAGAAIAKVEELPRGVVAKARGRAATTG